MVSVLARVGSPSVLESMASFAISRSEAPRWASSTRPVERTSRYEMLSVLISVRSWEDSCPPRRLVSLVDPWVTVAFVLAGSVLNFAACSEEDVEPRDAATDASLAPETLEPRRDDRAP